MCHINAIADLFLVALGTFCFQLANIVGAACSLLSGYLNTCKFAFAYRRNLHCLLRSYAAIIE
ncbi:hypothetical protein C8R48DRAFT_120032 [Suillus tomentosus]|nr:hypothetical protein C8R48DRAFT_120032 [Suillus tomentosus]